VYDTSGSLTKTQDYVGEVVYADGLLDYLIHEEGRVAYEDNFYQYEYFVKDHLGNVRQVLRIPEDQLLVATMEMENSADEELAFSQLGVSRQVGPEHNVTEGGNQVAWLNAERGRILGPGRTQEIHVGDSLTLQVHGKYADENVQQVNVGSYVTQAAKGRLVESLSELAGSLKHSGTGNPIALLNLADILASDLQHKKAPEAYMLYALYDADSNRYEVGKQVLTKNAANQHEILEENLYISQDGYMETFVVNETAEDVWFDNFMVMSTTSLVVQETHFDPWGLELTGLGFQAGGLNENRYFYQGKELINDLNLNIYDFHARGYDPVIGRTWQLDPMAESYYPWSPYAWVMNNPLKYMDPTGMFSTHTDEEGNVVAVYDDGDLGVYRHEGQVTMGDVESRYSVDNTSAGGEKMGETEYWDEFRAHDNKTGETLESIQRGSKILFNETWDYIINVKNRTSDQTRLSLTAFGSLPNQEFDIKTNSYFAPHGPATGKLLKGKYATARSAGNYLAGLNGATGKFSGNHISLKTYMRLAGTLHSGINNQGAPYYGEIPYAGRMIVAEFQSGINKRK